MDLDAVLERNQEVQREKVEEYLRFVREHAADIRADYRIAAPLGGNPKRDPQMTSSVGPSENKIG